MSTVHAGQLTLAAQALRAVWPLSAPVESALARFFRTHSQLGHADRALLADIVFAVIRRKRSLTATVGSEQAERLVCAALCLELGYPKERLHPLLNAAEQNWLRDLAPYTDNGSALSLDLPDWLWDKLGDFLSADERSEFAGSSLKPAALDLRVNTMLAKRADLLKALHGQGLEVETTPYSPCGLRLYKKVSLQRHPFFLAGQFEIQDESSQILAYLVAPKPYQTVVDFCAGAGGKTLMLGMLMRSKGKLFALDTDQKRLAQLKPRLQRSGLTHVQTRWIAHEKDGKLHRLANKADRVLVDAPCSGLGTLRRNPELKWRYTEQSLINFAEKQTAILRAAALLVKPGGRLVYATCSVLPEENQTIVENFLRDHNNMRVLDAGELLRKANIPLAMGQYLQLWPQRHQCDGFFAAAMEKV